MASLLDGIISKSIQDRGRLPGTGELLRENARQRGLLSGADAPPPPTPNIFEPNPAGRQAPNLRQLQGTAELAGAPGPEAADPRRVQQATEGAAEQAKRDSQAFLARTIAKHNNGELPPSADKYIREVTADNINSGAGREGRGFLGRLFAGERVPGLSDAANKRIRNEAMLRAGLTILGRRPGVNLGQALAGGLLMARQQATETAGQLLDERKRQQRLLQRYSVLSDASMTELERWQEIRRRSAAEGDLDAAEAAQDIIKDLKDRRQGEAERKPVPGTQGQLFHDGEGNVYDIDGNQLAADDPRFQPEQPQTSFERRSVPGVGVVEFELDPTGQVVNRRLVQGLPQEAAGGEGGGQVDPEKAQIAQTIQRELSQIRDLVGDDPETEETEIDAGRFGVTGSFGRLARFLPAELEPSDLKQMRAASQNILSLIIRQRSGAQATEAEVERLESFAVPKPGDDESTIRSKLERMDNIVRSFSQTGNANRAVDPIIFGGANGEVDSIISEEFGG